MDERALKEASAEENSLIGRCAYGDTDAFAELVKLKRALVHRIAARICGPVEADDVSQLVFVKLWREIPRLRDGAQVNRWLVRVAANQAIDTARHVGRRLKLVLARRAEHSSATPDEMLFRGELSRIFTDVAERLGERQRAAFVLREIEGCDTREVADALGVKPSTVRNLVRQARQGLKKALRERYPEFAPPGSRED